MHAASFVFLVLALIAGVVTFVYWLPEIEEEEDGRGKIKRKEKRVSKAIFAIPIAILALSLILGSLVTVPAGNKGVVIRFGDTAGVKDSGLSLKLPYIESVKGISVKTQKYDTPAAAATIDLQDIDTTVTVNYKLDPARVEDVYKTIGEGYFDVVAAPAIQETIKQITARHPAEDMIHQREGVKAEMAEAIISRLASRGIIAEEISITNFEFSPVFTEAIEAKMKAEMEIQTAKNTLEIIKVEAEQDKVRAEGEANATIAKALGDAKKLEIETDARIAANEKLTPSLTPEILNYIMLTELGEDIKLMVIPSDTSLVLPTPTP